MPHGRSCTRTFDGIPCAHKVQLDHGIPLMSSNVFKTLSSLAFQKKICHVTSKTILQHPTPPANVIDENSMREDIQVFKDMIQIRRDMYGSNSSAFVTANLPVLRQHNFSQLGWRFVLSKAMCFGKSQSYGASCERLIKAAFDLKDAPGNRHGDASCSLGNIEIKICLREEIKTKWRFVQLRNTHDISHYLFMCFALDDDDTPAFYLVPAEDAYKHTNSVSHGDTHERSMDISPDDAWLTSYHIVSRETMMDILHNNNVPGPEPESDPELEHEKKEQ